MVGADVAMMTSALLRHGPEHIATVEAELRDWMAEHDYDSVDPAARQRQPGHGGDPSAFERANYMKTLHSWETAADHAAPLQRS